MACISSNVVDIKNIPDNSDNILAKIMAISDEEKNNNSIPVTIIIHIEKTPKMIDAAIIAFCLDIIGIIMPIVIKNNPKRAPKIIPFKSLIKKLINSKNKRANIPLKIKAFDIKDPQFILSNFLFIFNPPLISSLFLLYDNYFD